MYPSKSYASLLILAFTFLIFTISTSGQLTSGISGIPKDTSINPHDFSDVYYQQNGVNVKEIGARLTGSDKLSIFGWSSNPNHNTVRVLITMPAYDQNGKFIFWSPLGDLTKAGFTDDKIGYQARETAKLFPMYVFPGPDSATSSDPFAGYRQAPIINDTWSYITMGPRPINQLGIRQVLFVNYTKKAFTEECAETMGALAKKNGYASDDTPIIGNADEIRELLEYQMISFDSIRSTASAEYSQSARRGYAIAPLVSDPTKGAIAPDAFLWMATKDGGSLAAEKAFEWHFACLQKGGEWCVF